ncbi:G-protein coupled receptor family C group 6 member A isoform X2 [Genypterus blacodes]|uniref:G-protein coupled receptor family C group 6 member A isoform X2 n=1 Tax=Genypterus blacodes TaxID=154954 RepID=UPI003F757435
MKEKAQGIMASVFYLRVVICFIVLDIGGCTSLEDGKLEGAAAPGDIMVAGIFSIHDAVVKENDTFSPQQQQCVGLNKEKLADALAMINAVETMNKSPLLDDVGVTLGYKIYDSCSDVSMALKATAEFTQQTDSDCGRERNTSTFDHPVLVVVGASQSEMSIAIARQLTLKMIPQISYSSTAVILSDRNRFPAFMRTVPNDNYQTAAMVRLLSNYGWNWAVETIHNNSKVHVIVSFSKPTDMRDLFRDLRVEALRSGQKSIRRMWVASDSWSSSSHVQGNLTLEDIGQVVGFTFKNGDLSSFTQYINRLKATGLDNIGNNSFMQKFYSQLNASTGMTDTALVSEVGRILLKNIHADTVLSIEMAVSAIAQAVASICRERDCKRPGTVQPWEVLKALSMHTFQHREKNYTFDSNGDINRGYDVTLWRSEEGIIHVHNVVAEYHSHNNSFTYTNHTSTEQLLTLRHIISKCSRNCVPGEFKKTAEGQHTCCYECVNCTENYYSNDTDMDQCLNCDKTTEWSPKGSSLCIPKELQFFPWQDGFAVVLLTFVVLGILLALLVSAVFLHHRSTPIVRAAGGWLCQVILFSLVCSFVSAVLFVGQPSSLQCKARQVLFGISFTLCVSCILVKSLKILLAFQFNPDQQGFRRRLYQPFVIVSACLALQVVCCICWLIFKSPFKQITAYPTTLLEDCHEGSYLAFGVMLGYIALLALICFICAFKGRKLPQKYNEAKFITFSMLLYLISWLLFVPVYVTTSGVYLPAVEMVAILISNYGILCCHFFPKCYVILFRKDQNTRSAFKENVYAHSRRYSNTAPVTEMHATEQNAIGQVYIISASSLFMPSAHPPNCAMVTKYDSINCTGLHKRSASPHICLRRSISF